MYVILLIRLWLFVNITLHLLCNWLGGISHFESIVKTDLHLVSRLRMSGDVSLIPFFNSFCSAVQVYLTSFIYPALIMFRIILLYLLCTMVNFWRNIRSCFSLHELRQPSKHCVYYSRTPLARTLVVQIANCPIRIGTNGKIFVNSTQLTCLEITGYRIQYNTVAWLLEL